MRRCTRPDWSTPSNDYCDCDDPFFDEATEAGADPCGDCKYCQEIEL